MRELWTDSPAPKVTPFVKPNHNPTFQGNQPTNVLLHIKLKHKSVLPKIEAR